MGSAVKLAKWRKMQGMTQSALANALGCTQPYVSQIERAQNPMVPKHELMARIFDLTNGQVGPTDFYDLPNLSRKNAA